MSTPADLRYTEQHEWVRANGATITIGITAHAADALGDVVFVQPPAAGSAVTAGVPCGEIESTKSVNDLYSPVDGIVTEVNVRLVDEPEIVGTDPYGEGWLFRVDATSATCVAELLDAAAYRQLTGDDRPASAMPPRRGPAGFGRSSKEHT